MSRTNADVGVAFIEGRRLNSLSMSTDGKRLLSYATPLAVKTGDGIWVVDDTKFSMTTAAKHFPALFRAMTGYNPTSELATTEWLVEKGYREGDHFATEFEGGWINHDTEWRLWKLNAPEYSIPRRLNPARAPRVKYMDAKTAQRIGLSRFPSFGPYGNVTGMRKKFYGTNALLVRSGAYVYNVTSEPEIYEMAK